MMREREPGLMDANAVLRFRGGRTAGNFQRFDCETKSRRDGFNISCKLLSKRRTVKCRAALS
jgi:hypothetical protein